MSELISIPIPPVITKIAMASRFTDAEYVGIIFASKTDVEVEAWLAKFNMASQINLQDPRTIAGMALLVSKNLVAQARADMILSAPPTPNEIPA